MISLHVTMMDVCIQKFRALGNTLPNFVYLHCHLDTGIMMVLTPLWLVDGPRRRVWFSSGRRYSQLGSRLRESCFIFHVLLDPKGTDCDHAPIYPYEAVIRLNPTVSIRLMAVNWTAVTGNLSLTRRARRYGFFFTRTSVPYNLKPYCTVTVRSPSERATFASYISFFPPFPDASVLPFYIALSFAARFMRFWLSTALA